MQTQLVDSIRNTPEGQEAEAILRSCVHCGFCTATCPTYQLLSDELDGPRGRIYLIKQMLEGKDVSENTLEHLDRCLLCRSCETTCPSGVQYGRLLDYGRDLAEKASPRCAVDKLKRRAILSVVPHAGRFGPLLKLGQLVRPVMPAAIRAKTPARQFAGERPQPRHPRRMIVLEGCAQPAATPRTNAAAARVLDRLGISLISSANAGCCGAANQHLSDHDGARQMIRANIDAWWPEIEQGAERIVVTASGCGVQVKDYGRLMASDPSYSDKAQRISELTADLGELFSELDLDVLGKPGEGRRIAYHAPCTLQHGQKLPGLLEGILGRLGFELVPVADPHLCCGSAGTYSLLQTGISKQLLGNKLRNLQSNHPELIATANVGCQLHLATGSEVPVVHWIELLDQETA